MEVSGRGVQERQPKPKGRLAATDKQVSLILKRKNTVLFKSSHLTAIVNLLEHQELLGNDK